MWRTIDICFFLITGTANVCVACACIHRLRGEPSWQFVGLMALAIGIAGACFARVVEMQKQGEDKGDGRK